MAQISSDSHPAATARGNTLSSPWAKGLASQPSVWAGEMLINISHCLFPDCHHYPTSETFRAGAQASLCWPAWLTLWVGNGRRHNCRGRSVQKGAGRQGKSLPPDSGRNISAVKRLLTESKVRCVRIFSRIPWKAQLDLEVLPVFPRRSQCRPLTCRGEGQCRERFPLFLSCISLLNCLNFYSVLFVARVSMCKLQEAFERK